MSTIQEIEAAIRLLSPEERQQLAEDLPGLVPELDGDAAWERIIRDTRPRPAFSALVDRIESAINEAGDVLIPRAEGAITDAHIVGELGDVLLGRLAGRTAPAEVTIFKSLGLAIEDLAAADLVLRKAEAGNVGLVVELGGRRDAS